MAQQRSRAGTLGGPHAVSLKVLRLSRPSLASQTTLPATRFGDGLDISPVASRAHPSAEHASNFPLTPLLTLPAAFGAAYVGETFACTLCANHEVPADGAGSSRRVTDVTIEAALQSSSSPDGQALELEGVDEKEEVDGGDEDGGKESEFAPGATMQRTLKHELRDEGPHVLAVTVTYTEHSSDDGATGPKQRTFRKLYQFVSQQLVAIRSKITERKKRGPHDTREWILEAQLENVGEASVVVEQVSLNEREGIGSQPVNGDADGEAVVLKPQDVEQVMFLLREREKSTEAAPRVPLAQLNVRWRSAMGERGSLTTGWLTSRGR